MSATVKQMDEAFIAYMLEIDTRYKVMSRGDQAKVEKWVIEFKHS